MKECYYVEWIDGRDGVFFDLRTCRKRFRIKENAESFAKEASRMYETVARISYPSSQDKLS